MTGIHEEVQRREAEQARSLNAAGLRRKPRNAARLRQPADCRGFSPLRQRSSLLCLLSASAARLSNSAAWPSKTRRPQTQASTESAGNEAEAKGNLIVAQTQEAIAAAQKATAELARATATAALGTAVADRQIASEKEAVVLTAQAKEAIERARAEANSKLANSRQLSPGPRIYDFQPGLAKLLAVEANDVTGCLGSA